MNVKNFENNVIFNVDANENTNDIIGFEISVVGFPSLSNTHPSNQFFHKQ